MVMPRSTALHMSLTVDFYRFFCGRLFKVLSNFHLFLTTHNWFSGTRLGHVPICDYLAAKLFSQYKCQPTSALTQTVDNRGITVSNVTRPEDCSRLPLTALDAF